MTIRMFGTTVQETLDALAAEPAGAHLGSAGKRKDGGFDERTKAIVRVVVTFVLLAVGVYCLVATEGQPQQVGTALLGLVGGYWLK